MTALNRSTIRRLLKLRQSANVWEGDRRLLIPPSAMALEEEVKGECILWVDGSEGTVRSMDLVSSDSGPESVVRTLIRAMETPQGGFAPMRPKKIVVCDREIQFFLRGVLQDLEIAVDYEPTLPLINEIFRGLQQATGNRPPQLPEQYAEPLHEAAMQIWEIAPWKVLDEEKIIQVELNYGDSESLYISLLGLLGMEYGVLMYRSIDSLKTFRLRVLQADDSPEQMEEAFLAQDCFFVTFDQGMDEEDLDDLEFDEDEEDAELVSPNFGNLHPLEGMRPVLYDDEAATVMLTLIALQKFFQKHLRSLSVDTFPALSGSYRLPDPNDSSKKLSVKVSTLPNLAEELFEMCSKLEIPEEFADFLNLPLPALRDDLVPRDAFFSLGMLPWETLTFLRASVQTHQSTDEEFPTKSDGFPVILIQTSRPKALAMTEALQSAGGLKAICFNPGENPMTDERYDLGILQTENGELHLFGEFMEEDPIHIQARKKWDQRCKKTKGYCGLVIAKGITGASRGNPGLKDMVALFEARSLSPEELGIGPLELMPQF